MLPDLTGLGDSGAIGSFVSGAKNMFNGNNNASPNATNAAQNTNTGDVSQQPYYNAQNLGNNCGPTSCSIAASKLT